MEKFGEDRTVVAQLVQWNFARKGVEEELKDESCALARMNTTPAGRVTPP